MAIEFQCIEMSFVAPGLGKPRNYGSYSINGIQIPPNKDLGIIIYKQLKFHEHTNTVVTKANRTLPIIRRSFNFTDKTKYLKSYWSDQSLNMGMLFGDLIMLLISNQLKGCRDGLLSICLTLMIYPIQNVYLC